SLEVGKLGRGVEEHNHNQQHRVGQHPIVADPVHAQRLGQGAEDDGGDDGAADGAHAAQHHQHQNFNGHVVVEAGGLVVGEAVAVDGTGHAGKEGGQDEHHELIIGDVHAVGFGGDAVIPDGHDGAAVAGALEVHHHDDDQEHQHDAVRQEGLGVAVDGGGVETLGAAGDIQVGDD